MKFMVVGWSKIAEEDVFKDGCQRGTAIAFGGQETFESDTIEGLIKELMAFTCTDDRDSVLLNACDEKGRIDIQVMEDEDSITADSSDIDAWKKGEKRLWLANYSFNVFSVETVDVEKGVERPSVVARISGGNCQRAMGHGNVDFRVFDDDNLEAEGFSPEEIEKQWEEITKGFESIY